MPPVGNCWWSTHCTGSLTLTSAHKQPSNPKMVTWSVSGPWRGIWGSQRLRQAAAENGYLYVTCLPVPWPNVAHHGDCLPWLAHHGDSPTGTRDAFICFLMRADWASAQKRLGVSNDNSAIKASPDQTWLRQTGAGNSFLVQTLDSSWSSSSHIDWFLPREFLPFLDLLSYFILCRTLWVPTLPLLFLFPFPSFPSFPFPFPFPSFPSDSKLA